MLQKKIKKIVLIGGGITNCVIALFLSKKNYQIDIYEKFDKLGGVLKDFQFDQDRFFRGVQYFDVENEWFSKVHKIFKNKLNVFLHTYGCH